MDDRLSRVETLSMWDVARSEPELVLGVLAMVAIFSIAAALVVRPIEFVSRAWRAGWR